MAYNRRSKNITEGVARAPNRSMYYAMGYKEERLRQADDRRRQRPLARSRRATPACRSSPTPPSSRIEEAGGNPQIFGTPTISDGMAMGTEGMKYSLVSREVIADCIETCVGGQWMDGVLVIGGCDKNMPGGMMGMLRANVPAIYVYGGTILPGQLEGQGPDHRQSSSRRSASSRPASMSEEDFDEIESDAMPGTGSCGGMYTANTMSSAFEALGMSLPYSTHDGEPRRGEGRLRRRIGARAGRGGQEGPEAARHRHEEVDRERRRRDHGDRRLDQRGAALPGDRARGRSRMDDRRLRAHAQEGAGDLRPEAVGQVPRGRPAPGRRHPAGDEDPARRRAAARRLHHDHRQDDRRELEDVPSSRAPTRT